jgi:hypothetical protein
VLLLLPLPSHALTFESSTQVVKNWDFIGPFPIGKGEVIPPPPFKNILCTTKNEKKYSKRRG